MREAKSPIQLHAESNARANRRSAVQPAVGWSGNEISGGIFNSADPGNHPDLTMEQWLGDTSSTGIGEQMLTDPDIAASVREWIEWAKNGNWTVEPADPDDPTSRMQAEFVRRCFFDISETRWAQLLENAMGQLVHGCAIAEPVYRWDASDRTPRFEFVKEPGKLPKWTPDGSFDVGHVVLDDLATRLPRSISRWHQDPQSGKFGGVYQYARQDDVKGATASSEIFLPADRLMLWTNQPSGNHWAGTGLFRPAYFIWRARQTLLRTGVISFERFGVGVPVAGVSKDALDMGLSKSELTSAWNDAMTQLARYRGGAQAWLALAPGLSVDIKEGQFSGAAGILDLYNALTIGIHTIGGTHHLIQGSQKVGTLDLVKEQSGDFRSTIMPTLRDVADVLNRSVVKALVDLNWAGVDGYPEIAPSDLETADVKKSLESYEIATRSGAVTPQAEDEEHFREQAGWPQRVEQEDGSEKDDGAAVVTAGSDDAPAQDTALNGAQVASAVDIVARVEAGQLPKATARTMLIQFFRIPEAVADAMLADVVAKAPSGAGTVFDNDDEPETEDDDEPDTLAETCPCGCQGVEILAEPAPMFEEDASPAMRIRMLAESQHDARASRISREDIVKRTAVQVHGMLGPKVIDPYLEKIRPMLEAGDALAISKVPLPGKAAIQRRLVRDYQDVRALAKSEVKREVKRMKDDDFQAALGEALTELRRGPGLFAENPSGLTNAIDDLGDDPAEVLKRLRLAAATTTAATLGGLSGAVNSYLQQVPASEWREPAIRSRALSVVTPRTMSKDITQDVNTTYTTARAQQGRIEGAGVVVYTVNPEIGINGPHEVCIECQETADSADNPALVGSDAEMRLVTPNPNCLSTRSGVNTCWCSQVYMTTTDVDAAADAAGLA